MLTILISPEFLTIEKYPVDMINEIMKIIPKVGYVKNNKIIIGGSKIQLYDTLYNLSKVFDIELI